MRETVLPRKPSQKTLDMPENFIRIINILQTGIKCTFSPCSVVKSNIELTTEFTEDTKGKRQFMPVYEYIVAGGSYANENRTNNKSNRFALL